MTRQNGDCSIVALVIDLLDGSIRPVRAACGLPAPFLNLFRLIEKLGRLDRGETIELDAGECDLLDEMLDFACEQERRRKPPSASAEVIAAMIKRVAVENKPLEEWAWNLNMGMLTGKGWTLSRQT